jgi:hypothetical protein
MCRNNETSRQRSRIATASAGEITAEPAIIFPQRHGRPRLPDFGACGCRIREKNGVKVLSAERSAPSSGMRVERRHVRGNDLVARKDRDPPHFGPGELAKRGL